MRTTLGTMIAIPGRGRATWITAFAVIATLLLLPLIVRLDGSTHADWQQFLGRFHPLAVHIPIGLIALVPLLEIAGKRRPALREAASFVLTLACAASLTTLALGYLLAYGSGDTGSTVSQHMWGGIALTVGLLLCWLARPLWPAAIAPRVYPALLACVILTLLWTAHKGGSLTHGRGYLTRFMPHSLRFTAVNAAVPNPDSFYARRVHPLLDAHCASCHGSGKVKGGLRLDTYEALIRGGKSGAVVIPGEPEKSPLLVRVALPPSDQHFMPAEGRPPLSPGEIGWLRAWIQQGASPSATAVAGVNIPEPIRDPLPQPVGDYTALMGEIQKMQQSNGVKFASVSSNPADGLILNTVNVAPAFGDAELSHLLKFAPFIVEANLARTAITDASFDTLSHFTRLRALHLEGTSISGNGLAKLIGLSQMSYLNLSGTRVSSAAIAPLKSMPNLRHVYLFDTPAQPASTSNVAQVNSRSNP